MGGRLQAMFLCTFCILYLPMVLLAMKEIVRIDSDLEHRIAHGKTALRLWGQAKEQEKTAKRKRRETEETEQKVRLVLCLNSPKQILSPELSVCMMPTAQSLDLLNDVVLM